MEVEKCEEIECFLSFHSFSGGTGSGVTTLVLENLSIKFEKVKKFNVSLYPPTNVSSSTVEIYNLMLSFHTMTEHSNLDFCYDNEAILKYLRNQRGLENAVLEDINQVIIESVLSIFSPIYTDSSEHETTSGSDTNLVTKDSTSKPPSVDCSRMTSNLVPYPRTHFICPSFSKSTDIKLHSRDEGNLVKSLTNTVLDYNNYLIDCATDKATDTSCKHGFS